MKTFVAAAPLLLLLATALLLDAPPVVVLPHDVAPPIERTWREQVAEVEAGRREAIVVAHEVIGDEQLRDVRTLTMLQALELGESRVTASGIQHLAALHNFRRLTLRGEAVDDELFTAICRIPTVRYLNLPHTTVTDNGLAALALRPQLVQLRLGSPQLTNAGLAQIGRLKKLRFLHLIDVPLTDAGLGHLAGLTNLESLYLDGARITDAGVSRLLTTRPQLHLHFDQQHHDLDPHRHDHVH